MLTAGFGKVCVSPPEGSPLAGFAAREGVSRGTHDDLFVRALVLENGGVTLALLSVDVLALSGEFVDRMRSSIATRFPIARDAIMIASTHTHAGPVTIRTFFNPEESVDAGYMDRLAAAIEECAVTAWNRRFAARIGVGSGRAEGIGLNRRSADKLPVDEEVGLIKVDDGGGRTRAVLVNYACHPTVLGPDNLLASGDFPATTADRIEGALGPGSFAMFVNGTQGNISVGHSSELSAIGVVTPGRTFARARALGSQLADAVLRALGGIQTRSEVTLRAATVPLDLPLKKYPPPEATQAALCEARSRLETLSAKDPGAEECRRAKSELLYSSITHFYAGETAGLRNGTLRIELQGVRIDDTVFVAVPAEVFVEIGLRLKASAPCRTFVVGIANGYIGYLPSRDAYPIGGYEVVSAKCGPDAEDRLVEGVLGLEQDLLRAQ